MVMSGSNSEPKVHDPSLHEPATNAANVAGLIASKQPFVVDESGAIVQVSTFAEAVAVVDAVSEPVPVVEESSDPVVPDEPKKAKKPAQKKAKKPAQKKAK
jgi:BRCT domain type II-containing protein